MGCTLAERNPSIFKQEIKGRPQTNAFWRNPHKKRKKLFQQIAMTVKQCL